MGNLTLIPNLKSQIDFCLRILEKNGIEKNCVGGFEKFLDFWILE